MSPDNRVKVIASFDGPREARTGTSFPYHDQLAMTRDEARAMLADVLLAEDHTCHVLPVINGRDRPNSGGSFGAYDFAWSSAPAAPAAYDWWLFTEDDIVIGGENYFSRLIARFESEKDCGFLALAWIGGPYAHAAGGVGLTHRSVLERVHQACGCLPHPCGDRWQRRLVEIQGEVGFSAVLQDLGYRLAIFGDNISWNWDRNLCLPYPLWKERLPA